MEHAILAPTAFNIQNWRFVRVTDPEQRKAIRAVAWDQAQVTDASELLVLCLDIKAGDETRALLAQCTAGGAGFPAAGPGEVLRRQTTGRA